MIAGGVIVLLLIVIAVLGWKYTQANKASGTDNKTTSARVIKGVGQLYLLPTDEEPTVAQIQDKTKLENQDFFKQAQNGDYLLLYKKNKLAIVYRENVRKLVTVGPINLDQNAANPTPATAAQ